LAHPKAWLVRTGSSGEHDDWALEHAVVFIGFDDIADVSGCTAREDVFQMYVHALPDANPKAVLNWSAQVWAFASRMQVGDLAVLPL
jgi:restriction system protein